MSLQNLTNSDCTEELVFDWVDIVNSILLFGLFFGLGMSCHYDDLKQVYLKPKAMLIIMLGQFVLMPFLAWVFAKMGNLEPIYAAALVISCAAPGGATSNMLAVIFQSDIALSVGATALSSLIAIGTMPFNQYMYIVVGNMLGDTPDVCYSFAGVLFSAALVVLSIFSGVGLKLLFQRYKQYWAIKLVYAFSTFCGVAMLIFGMAVNMEGATPWYKMPNGGVKFICIILPNIVGGALAWLAGWYFKMTGPAKTTIFLEVSVHNKPVAITVLSFLFRQEVANEVFAVPILFSLWAIVYNTICCIILWKRGYTDMPKEKSFCEAYRLGLKAQADRRHRDVYGKDVNDVVAIGAIDLEKTADLVKPNADSKQVEPAEAATTAATATAVAADKE